MENDSNQNGELMDHQYDGIQEYDNPLPNWWLVTLFATIIFAFVYYIHYTFGGGLTQAQELEIEMNALPKVSMAQWKETDLQDQMAVAGIVDGGKEIFAGKCASCHGPEGQGLIGPNLTDKAWLHGKGSRADLMKVISEGVLEKGMPAWGTMISDKDVLKVAAYVHSLKGTNPSNPKPPQGTEVSE